TYSGQGELFFALYAGHGEFPRVVIAPGDPEEAMAAARDALNLAWQFQIPVIVLADKHLCESAFSSEPEKIAAKIFPPKLWDKQGTYRRYALTEDGVSPLCFPGEPGAVVKSDSYEHDEDGITTEEAEMAVKNADKRMRKAAAIAEELKKRETVKTYGPSESENVLLVWGSTKGSAIEAAALTGCRVVQPLYLEPFPEAELKEKLKNAKKIIGVELNSGGQLCRLAASHGIKIDERILKYDGRPFTADAIAEKVRKLI
ncbi:MAG TPA: pyruvate ferredoxin oxidoreductase, partial [Candidatus Methylomirabilis sp.]|nr:pyruvate ferredoxin oxidoreductase [Candidatus Methylomirabilis sp.]